jgi:TRAP-type C4-dicarboxylate transport system permease small subunit
MVAFLALMVVMVFGNVVLRYGFNSGITASEELSRWLFLWVIFLGATVAIRERLHMGVDMLVEMLPPWPQKACLLIGHGCMLWVTWLMLHGSVQLMQMNWDIEAPVTGLSQGWFYASGVVFAASTALMLAVDTWRIATGQLTPRGMQLLPDVDPSDATTPPTEKSDNRPS